MPLFRRTPEPPKPNLIPTAADHGPLAARTQPAVARSLGQTALVLSDRLPVDTGGTDSEFRTLGFRFDAPDEDDPVFRRADTPFGWTREAADDRMWSYLVDRERRRRVVVFYDAAPDRRRARMHLVTVAGYLEDCMTRGGSLVVDHEWSTRLALTDLMSAAIAAIDDELEHVVGETHARRLAHRDAYRRLMRQVRAW